jgi:hypothetical protein
MSGGLIVTNTWRVCANLSEGAAHAREAAHTLVGINGDGPERSLLTGAQEGYSLGP